MLCSLDDRMCKGALKYLSVITVCTGILSFYMVLYNYVLLFIINYSLLPATLSLDGCSWYT